MTLPCLTFHVTLSLCHLVSVLPQLHLWLFEPPQMIGNYIPFVGWNQRLTFLWVVYWNNSMGLRSIHWHIYPLYLSSLQSFLNGRVVMLLRRVTTLPNISLIKKECLFSVYYRRPSTGGAWGGAICLCNMNSQTTWSFHMRSCYNVNCLYPVM